MVMNWATGQSTFNILTIKLPRCPPFLFGARGMLADERESICVACGVHVVYAVGFTHMHKAVCICSGVHLVSICIACDSARAQKPLFCAGDMLHGPILFKVAKTPVFRRA